MGQSDYVRQRIALLRDLAASINDDRSRLMVSSLADRTESRSNAKLAAMKMIRDRVYEQ